MWKPPRGRGRRKNVVDFEIASSVFELEARWVANNFDPPAVINLFKDLCANDGLSILMVTHDPVLASMADRMLLLKDGVTAASDIRSAWGIEEE